VPEPEFFVLLVVAGMLFLGGAAAFNKVRNNSRDIFPASMKRLIAIGLALFLVASATAQEISWSVPEDGGTPRDASRIERVGPGEFRIRAAFEEGGPIVLRHAVSRVELTCRNDSLQAVSVTVHLDLSGDAQRTDYDNKPEAGMALRDFVFIQAPGQDWRQINGSTNGWVASVKFKAEPGETRLGLSPWYPYADYLRFVNALPNHPHLEKKIAGKSDGGREHWELTITDPTSDAKNKRTIFWQEAGSSHRQGSPQFLANRLRRWVLCCRVSRHPRS
jgi:hypothetical protein